jgi:hypothetical protein
VYQMDPSQWKAPLTKAPTKHELPSERYLDIIAQGCAAYGVDEKWVSFIRAHANTPRKNPRDFSSFRMNSLQIPILSWEKVRGCNGKEGSPLWVVINNKVLEFKGDTNSFFPCGYFVKVRPYAITPDCPISYILCHPPYLVLMHTVKRSNPSSLPPFLPSSLPPFLTKHTSNQCSPILPLPHTHIERHRRHGLHGEVRQGLLRA